MHSFTTERLLIRPLAEQDKALYISLYSDAKIMRNIGEPLSLEAAEKAFNSTLKAMSKEKPKVMTWTIARLEDSISFGIQGLHWQKPDTADIGIMLLRNSNGRLLPEEAMGALMEYAFGNLSLDRINACYDRKNLATKRFVNKLGFTFDKVQRPKNTNDYYQHFNKDKWQKNLISQIL